MSWLSNILPQKNVTSDKQAGSRKKAYLSIEYFSLRILIIDESVMPKKIVFWKEIPTGPFEDLEEGKPVKNIFDVVGKILSQEVESFKDIVDVSVSLPADGIFYRTIEVPKMDSVKMNQLIIAEIKANIPVDFSQILYAQNDLGEKHEGQKTFFCVCIQKNLFEGLKTVFSKYNLNPYFEIEVFSLARIPLRDNKYKLMIFVSKQNTYLIFLEGQIIQEVIVHDMGDDYLTNMMVKDTGLAYKDINILREGHGVLKEEGRFGGQILDEYLKDFNLNLGKVVALSILNFEKRFACEIKDLLVVGADSNNRLAKAIHDEFDAEVNIEMLSDKYFDQFVAEDFPESDVKRFAQCFGLAKRG